MNKALLIGALPLALALSGCGNNPPKAAEGAPAAAASAAPAATDASVGKARTLPDGLQITDERIGTGDVAEAGKTVTVNYVGTLENGAKFDSSYDRHQPFSFQLGAGQVIKGWDEGVAGMKVGGKRQLVIPADLAYGAQSPSPAIPPNSTLVFEIELLGVK